METLTESQKKVFEAIRSFIMEKGYSPSFRELAGETGLASLDTVYTHVKNLERKGAIRYPGGRSRGIELARDFSPASNSVRIPLLGTVPAGAPNLASEQYGEFMDVDKSLVKGESFCLEVKGDSMKDAHILEGDILVVRLQQAAEDEDIVVAQIEDEATVKRLRKRKDGVYLVPANEKYKPIPAGKARVIGKVTGVMRNYNAGQRS